MPMPQHGTRSNPPQKQKRAGRKKVYTRKFLLPLSEDQWQRAQKIAVTEDLTVCDVFRSALYRKLPRKVTTVAAQTYWELGKIGTNLNQIAAAVNTARLMGEPVSVDRALLERLRELVQQARAEIVGIEPNDADD